MGGQGDRAEPRGTACEMLLRCAQQPAALPAPIARDLSVCGADRALCDCVRVRAVPPPAELRAPSIRWHAPPKTEPNDTEILFFAFLLVAFRFLWNFYFCCVVFACKVAEMKMLCPAPAYSL